MIKHTRVGDIQGLDARSRACITCIANVYVCVVCVLVCLCVGAAAAEARLRAEALASRTALLLTAQRQATAAAAAAAASAEAEGLLGSLPGMSSATAASGGSSAKTAASEQQSADATQSGSDADGSAGLALPIVSGLSPNLMFAALEQRSRDARAQHRSAQYVRPALQPLSTATP